MTPLDLTVTGLGGHPPFPVIQTSHGATVEAEDMRVNEDGDASDRWRLRSMLEGAGLRVMDLRRFRDRPYRWSVWVLAGDSTEREIQSLRGVDVVRYRRLDGSPDQFVVTVDEPRPKSAGRGPRPPSPRRGGRGLGGWSQA